MEFVYSTPSCGEEDLRPALMKDVHYLYFALILLALTVLIITSVSLCTAPIPEQHVTINRNSNTCTFKQLFISIFIQNLQKGDKSCIPKYLGILKRNYIHTNHTLFTLYEHYFIYKPFPPLLIFTNRSFSSPQYQNNMYTDRLNLENEFIKKKYIYIWH